MSRGLGAIQRQVLDALINRANTDKFDMRSIPNAVTAFYNEPPSAISRRDREDTAAFLRKLGVPPAEAARALLDDYYAGDDHVYFPVVHARWRWYTVDLLGLAHRDCPRSQRVSLHRAISKLHQANRVEVKTGLPYPQPFGPAPDRYEPPHRRIDLGELSLVDPRWPERPERCLWFRWPPPPRRKVPKDDQLYLLRSLAAGETFLEFVELLDRRQAWESEFGRFLRWLFCGSPATNTITSLAPRLL